MTNQTNTKFKSSQGQRAGALQLHFEELTKNEQLLVTALAKPARPVMTIKEIQAELGWDRLHRSDTMSGYARGCSRVRNTLRRLVRSQWVTHKSEVGDGQYRLTKNALDRLRRLVNDTEPKEAVQAAEVTTDPAPEPIADVLPATPDAAPAMEEQGF